MENLNEALAEVLEKHDIPSVAAALIVDGELRAAGAVGVRKRGDSTPVTVNDKYHVGSCTKAMTATLAGMLVERGLLSWETPLKDVFTDINIRPGYQPSSRTVSSDGDAQVAELGDARAAPHPRSRCLRLRLGHF